MTVEPPSNSHPEPADSLLESPKGSWVVSLLFWGAILVSWGLYGVVALAPKLVIYLQLRDEHYQTQVKLITLERRVMHLKKVMHALETDPTFAAEQARVELGTHTAEDERIPVDERWHFTPDPAFDPSAFKESILPWYAPLLQVFAQDQKTRDGMLIAACAIALFAFTFLQESQTPQLVACAKTVKTGWNRATARYRTPPATQEKSSDPEGSIEPTL